MMVNPSKYEIELFDAVRPWLLFDASTEEFYLKEDAPEDIIKKYLYQLLSEWDNEWKQKNSDSNAELFGHLFMHLKQHGDMMMLIQKRGLFHLFKESYLTLWGPSEIMDNMTAYTVVLEIVFLKYD